MVITNLFNNWSGCFNIVIPVLRINYGEQCHGAKFTNIFPFVRECQAYGTKALDDELLCQWIKEFIELPMSYKKLMIDFPGDKWKKTTSTKLIDELLHSLNGRVNIHLQELQLPTVDFFIYETLTTLLQLFPHLLVIQDCKATWKRESIQSTWIIEKDEIVIRKRVYSLAEFEQQEKLNQSSKRLKTKPARGSDSD